MDYLLYNIKNKTIQLYPEKDVIDKLYFLEATIPTHSQLKTYNGTNKKILTIIKKPDPIEKIRKDISKIDYKIPLYDVNTKNLYIINRDNVYHYVTYLSYRFPDEYLIKNLIKKKNKLESKIKQLTKISKETTSTAENLSAFEKEYTQKYSKDILVKREYHKLTLMLEFLESFDLETLRNTYVKTFYYYANEVGKNITVCTRPSFMSHFKHIKPYYSRSELINLGLNLELIKPSNEYYDSKKIMELCEIIRENDIKAETIMEHQKYIASHNKIGLVQYYSQQGSYFMNQYMRGFVKYHYKNTLLEDNIKSMWELINDAPEFDKSYILYRFISNDEYLRHLKIGDTFTDPSFISTTRDPFYRSDIYKFGFILIKIKIPKDQRGVALCIESYSHFPEEEEILLSPLSMLKLDKKDENAVYYHTDNIFSSQVKTRYEFTYVGKKEISFIEKPLYATDNQTIDFLHIDKPDALTMKEKIRYFVDHYVNPMYQYKTKIGKHTFDIMTEWYDSTGAYKEFYAVKTNDGFCMYTLVNNYISFMIELGDEVNEIFMYVNFYFRYSSVSIDKKYDDKEFIDFISQVAYYFGIHNVVIYCEYESCDISGDSIKSTNDDMIGGNNCIDFKLYLKNKIKKYNNDKIKINISELKPQFSYYELDRLRTVDPLLKVLDKNDHDEIYQIYIKTYKPFVDKSKLNLVDFYLWMIENHCESLDMFIDKFSRFYNQNNPFDNDFYILDASTYLYNNGMIDEIPFVADQSVDQSADKLSTDEKTKDMPKNEYRLQISRGVRSIRGMRDIKK